jgi:cellulose synthase/poly-beta-1,6-N-acetylglucosamine synthase-like glycosyltransferase
MAVLILLLYGLCLLFISCYSLVQLHLTYLYLRAKGQAEKAGQAPDKTPYQKDWPAVTVQLPVYNEVHVVERLLDAVAAFDYPPDKLQIQVLDDSTDETTNLIRQRIAYHRERGVEIELVRRPDRSGDKAGALGYGLERARGEFISIFDADFLPGPDFLKRTLPAFTSPRVGVVQTRWAHLNENYSLLTQLQAFGLDAHFTIEQVGRNTGGHFINFNGTAGVWRKACIQDAGGWQADTLTEDLDLSYRAQLKGWEFRYLEQVAAPAELPAAMNALKSQQFRWTKGAAENARKNLRNVLQTSLPFRTKLHAFFHLLNSSVFVCVLLTALLSIPVLFIKEYRPDLLSLFRLASVFLFGLLVLIIFYGVAFYARQPASASFWGTLRTFVPRFFLFLSMIMGLSLHNALAVLEGYAGRKSPFIRTPKFNIVSAQDSWRHLKYAPVSISLLTALEGLLALYFGFGLVLAFWFWDFTLLPFHLLLFLGFGAVFFYSIRHAR